MSTSNPNNRKLASVQRIKTILPHDNADSLELARVLGWQVVVRKGDFQPGDLGVYFELDAVLPDVSWTEWIKKRGLRVCSLKLRGQLSQGLFLKLSDVIDGMRAELAKHGQEMVYSAGFFTEGTDLTEILGVTQFQYEEVAMNFRAAFPRFLSKTAETRLQTHPDVMPDLMGKRYVATEKIDGQSGTFLIHPDDGLFHCGSRSLSVIDEPVSPYWAAARKFGLDRILAENPNYVVQGEVFGVHGDTPLAKNKYKMNRLDFGLFNVFDIGDGFYLSYDDAVAFANLHSIPLVPLVERGDSFNYTMEEAVALADGKSQINPDVWREGIVIRSATNEYSKFLNDRLSIKIISNAWLLKYEGS